MKNFIKSNWLFLSICLFFLIFGVIFPDLSITVTGGFAWWALAINLLVGFSLIWVCIVGGELKLESKGLVGWIKEFKNKNSE